MIFYYYAFCQIPNLMVSLEGMISLLFLATSVLGFQLLVPKAAASPIDEHKTTDGGTTTTTMSDNTSLNATTTTTTTTPTIDLAEEPLQYHTTEQCLKP
jgi:hypothetical protein